MKAMVVTPYYHPKIGGLEAYARQLNLAMHKYAGWEICIVTSNPSGRRTERATVDGMVIYRLGTWLRLSNTPLNPLWPLIIRRTIAREKPDLILAHTPVPSLADAAALAAGRTPFTLVYHAASLAKPGDPVFNAVERIYRLYQRITLRKALHIFAVSEHVKRQFNQKTASKMSVLPNCIWENDIVQRDQPRSADNFLFVGSLDRSHRWKGLELVIEALAIYHGAYDDKPTLTVLGDGNYRSHYEALAAKYGVAEFVTFLGMQVGNAKEEAFRKAGAVVVYPTSSNDGFPTVILEAWSKGVPVIAAAAGPLPSLVNDEDDAFVTAACDARALACKLRELSTMSRGRRAEAAARGVDRVRDSYTWERRAPVLAQWAEAILS